MLFAGENCLCSSGSPVCEELLSLSVLGSLLAVFLISLLSTEVLVRVEKRGDSQELAFTIHIFIHSVWKQFMMRG